MNVIRSSMHHRRADRWAAVGRALSTLIVAEHAAGRLAPSLPHVVTAARQLDPQGPIDVLVAGEKGVLGPIAESAASLQGVDTVLVAEHPAYAHLLAENMTRLIQHVVGGSSKSKYTHVVTASSSFGKNVMPRLAAKLGAASIADVTSVTDPNTFTRPIYAGNAMLSVRSTDAIKVVTIRATSFGASEGSSEPARIEAATLPSQPETNLSKWIDEVLVQNDRPDLRSAKVVIAGGRGLKSAEQFQLLYKLADKIGGAVGASRAAVDAGFCSNDLQIGQTGAVVAPNLYIAIGISGAIQHIAGMKDSKVIVAINKDKESPIFQIADYGLVADLFQALPELEAGLTKPI